MFSLKSSNDIKSFAEAADEFQNLIAQLNTWAQQQHMNDGSHGAITAPSVAINGVPVGVQTNLANFATDPALFSASGTSVWTVPVSGNVIFTTMQFNKLAYANFVINTSTVSVAAPTNLFISIPQFTLPNFVGTPPNNDAIIYVGGYCQWVDWQHSNTSNSGLVGAINLGEGTGTPNNKLVLYSAPSFNGNNFPLSNNLEVRGYCIFPLLQ